MTEKINSLACLHLNEVKELCEIGRRFPRDCNSCAAYNPSPDPTIFQRQELWIKHVILGEKE